MMLIRQIQVPFQYLLLVALITTIPLAAEETNNTSSFFEIPLKKEVKFNAAHLDGFFSSELLKVRNSMTPQDLVKALPNIDFGKPDTFMSGKTPGNSYLEKTEVYYESGKLQNLALSSWRIPPSKNLFLSWMLEIERLIGPPTLAYRNLSNGAPDEQSLTVVWSPNPNALMLNLKRQGDKISIDLIYYPGPANPGLKRVAAIKRHPVAFKSFKILLEEYIERIGIFQEGDASVPTLKLPEGESNLLREYTNQSILNPADMSRDDREVKLPLITKIEAALDKQYEKMSENEKYERLCLIAENKVPDFGSGEVQVGAARFLARHHDPKVLPYLFRGLKVELPEGVSSECEAGIAKQCDDTLLDKLLEMRNKGNLSRENLGGILTSIPTKRQYQMLMSKRDNLTGDNKELVDAAIAMLRRYKLLD